MGKKEKVFSSKRIMVGLALLGLSMPHVIDVVAQVLYAKTSIIDIAPLYYLRVIESIKYGIKSGVFSNLQFLLPFLFAMSFINAMPYLLLGLIYMGSMRIEKTLDDASNEISTLISMLLQGLLKIFKLSKTQSADVTEKPTAEDTNLALHVISGAILLPVIVWLNFLCLFGLLQGYYDPDVRLSSTASLVIPLFLLFSVLCILISFPAILLLLYLIKGVWRGVLGAR